MNEPMLSLWFGNFFEPFYSDADAVRRGVADVASLGFTTVNLDSKPWEDFFARYRGEPASQYVATHELMMAEAAAHGMDHTSLALYLCGDNLYPTIRDVPPVRGREAVRPDGSGMGTYDYAAPEARASMVEHVQGLLGLYGQGMRRAEDGRPIVQTMFDPIPKPSFDEAGRARYLAWLERRYGGDVAALNQAYGVSVAAFADLTPEQYWLRPEELTWVGCALPTAADLADPLEPTPDGRRWLDNQSYLAELGVSYLADMHEEWRALGVFAEPVLHQWGYVVNPPSQRDWQTGQRALDVYRAAPHVDGVLVIAAPLNPDGRADAAVVSLEAAVVRTASAGRPHTGGLYLGRHVVEDVYRQVPPAEAIATHVAGGAHAMHAYGYSGLDDGGVLFRTDETFRDSVRAGTWWARAVMPQLTGRRAREVAVLFPAETSVFQPAELEPAARSRTDLLGWYSQLVDLGWNVDVLHPDQVIAGALADYRHLVIPANPLEGAARYVDGEALAGAVRAFAEGGGTVLHGPGSRLAARAFGITEEPEPFDTLAWTEDVIPHGWSTVAYTSDGEALAVYETSRRAGLLRTRVGSGSVVSFGFEYGHAYAARSMPIVPPRYGRREMHPVVLLRTTPVEELLGVAPEAPFEPVRGLEVARFDGAVVVVNHRASPVELRPRADVSLAVEREIPMLPTAPGWVPAHSAVLLVLAED